MTRDLGLLPGVQAAIGPRAQVLGGGAQSVELMVRDAGIGGGQRLGQRFDLGFKLSDRALEVEVVARGSGHTLRTCENSAKRYRGR